jgi:tRNA threonylcarbamoyladenosine biosynthesis protein TsaE
MRSIAFLLADTATTHALGRQLGRSLNGGCVILLEGDLGAGKTTLIQGLGEGLGITDAIVSPTFTLINEYPEGRVPLYHFDLYRLDSTQVAGLQPEIYWEGMEVDPGIVAIEWSERLPYKPSNYLHICLTHQEESRQVELTIAGTIDLDLEKFANFS